MLAIPDPTLVCMASTGGGSGTIISTTGADPGTPHLANFALNPLHRTHLVRTNSHHDHDQHDPDPVRNARGFSMNVHGHSLLFLH